MRIIKEGVIPILEYVFNCNFCGCKFAVTETELNETPFLNKGVYRCPTCKKPISQYEVQAIEEEDLPSVQDEDNDTPTVDPIEGE